MITKGFFEDLALQRSYVCSRGPYISFLFHCALRHETEIIAR